MPHYLDCLAVILTQETGYRQPVGGPYVRFVPTKKHAIDPRESGQPDGRAFDDDPDDSGGRTGMGILQREYDAWRRARGLMHEDVWHIADDELTDIYKRQFWDAVRADKLRPGVDLMTFNTAVNCGTGTAIGQLQQALGLRVDRHLGEVTLQAAYEADPQTLISKLADLQRARYRRLSTFWKFGDNWLRRTREVEILSLNMSSEGPVALSLISPPEEASPARGVAEPVTSMAQSSTGRAAEGTAALSVPQLGMTIAKVAATPGLSVGAMLLLLLQEPLFWTALGTIACAVYIWIERARHIKDAHV